MFLRIATSRTTRPGPAESWKNGRGPAPFWTGAKDVAPSLAAQPLPTGPMISATRITDSAMRTPRWVFTRFPRCGSGGGGRLAVPHHLSGQGSGDDEVDRPGVRTGVDRLRDGQAEIAVREERARVVTGVGAA